MRFEFESDLFTLVSLSLGMAHDSTGNYCAKEGYIMSPSRGTQGETSWSSCSAQVARDLPK